jgi:hypothetical protein
MSAIGLRQETSARLESAAAAFGLAACIAVLFNTVLAWIEDVYDPLADAMAALTGHRWITHGLADVILFLAIGLVLARAGFILDGAKLTRAVAGSVVAAGAGLALWFALF